MGNPSVELKHGSNYLRRQVWTADRLQMTHDTLQGGQLTAAEMRVAALAASVASSTAAITYSFRMASSIRRIRQIFNQTTHLSCTKAGHHIGR